MSEGNGSRGAAGREALAAAMAARRRAGLVGGLRGLARGDTARPPRLEVSVVNPESPTAASPRPDGECCDMCGRTIPVDHRHLLHLTERRILCACEACIALRSGEDDLRPTGVRTLWLGELDVPDDLWASFAIPIGLAFFMKSTVTDCVVAMYPSPGGATESELRFDSWQRMLTLNPVLGRLEADIEGLLVNRLSEPAGYAIAPIDRCYELTGLIKASWEGISGGEAVREAVDTFFADLRHRAVAA